MIVLTDQPVPPALERRATPLILPIQFLMDRLPVVAKRLDPFLGLVYHILPSTEKEKSRSQGFAFRAELLIDRMYVPCTHQRCCLLPGKRGYIMKAWNLSG